MEISYNNLWKLLIDRNMRKKDLAELTGISTATMAKLGRGDSVSLDVIIRICEKLDCDISDVVSIVKDNK